MTKSCIQLQLLPKSAMKRSSLSDAKASQSLLARPFISSLSGAALYYLEYIAEPCLRYH